jgi:hypothetical protein
VACLYFPGRGHSLSGATLNVLFERNELMSLIILAQIMRLGAFIQTGQDAK